MSNDKRPVVYDSNLNFFRNVILQARLVWLLFRDPRVPLWLKTLPLGSLAYLIFPLDFDAIPVLGYADDLVVVALGFSTFISLCPPQVVEEHLQELKGDTGGWTVDSKRETKPAADDPNVIEGAYTEPPDEPKP
jgi:uncharacterized membrane protein YkvA (DUF1232 family)